MMKITLLSLCLVFVCLILVTCNENEVTPRNYPRVRTLEVSHITENGVRLEGEIFYPGRLGVTEYGFIWSTKENLFLNYAVDRAIIPANGSVDHYAFDLNTTLKKGEVYYVKAYARDKEYLVYGDIVSFRSLGSNGPEVLSVYPDTGTLGDTISVKGKNFSYITSSNEVTFNDFGASVVGHSTDTTVMVVVPDPVKLSTCEVKVSIAGNPGTGQGIFTLQAPVIDSLSTDHGKSGEEVIIYGKYMGSNPNNVKVSFDSKEVQIISHKRKAITVRIPYDYSHSGKLRVQVANLSDETAFSVD